MSTRRNPARPQGYESPNWRTLFASLAQTARNAQLQRFYQAGAVSLQTPIEEVPLVALDVETTGLDPKRDAIVSIGLMPFSLQRIRCADARYHVVKPISELNAESVAFHRITHSDLSQAPRLDSLLGEILDVMAGRVVVAHYRSIERGFLDETVRHYLNENLHFPVIDTMELEARMHRGANRPGWFDRLRGRKEVSIRLAESRLRYGLPLYQAHHALTDALATAELLQAQIASHFEPGTPVGDLWD
ncbi:3'-5' exonuclease [uncultured Halopseudomonas sp.]|uniref:3'-5' exonuclease n=1 Tax=uncultured Halopseudomonas sp. TaxID=2901193 RepID=UPI0030EE6EF3|tara:strand:- start:677 stop:1414 length:738 start_codon:yes stop_codon:yes gene_type:complete